MPENDRIVEAIEDALLDINRIRTAEIVEEYWRKSHDLEQLEELIIRTLMQIGEGWDAGRISLAQVYMSGVICEELIEKYLPETALLRKDSPKMAICTLQDYHGLGKRIVCSLLRAGGYEIRDYGLGLTAVEAVERALEDEVEVLLISTLMYPSALKVKEVKEELQKRNIGIKVLVGGAPFRLDSELWKEVGADGCSANASELIAVLERVVDRNE